MEPLCPSFGLTFLVLLQGSLMMFASFLCFAVPSTTGDPPYVPKFWISCQRWSQYVSNGTNLYIESDKFGDQVIHVTSTYQLVHIRMYNCTQMKYDHHPTTRARNQIFQAKKIARLLGILIIHLHPIQCTYASNGNRMPYSAYTAALNSV